MVATIASGEVALHLPLNIDNLTFSCIYKAASSLAAKPRDRGALIKRICGNRRQERDRDVHAMPALQPSVRNPITITNAMPIEDILVQFVRSGCKDLTHQLETCQISQHPVSNGGFGDIYRGTLPNRQQVGLKCLRLQVGPSEDDQRHLRRAAQELHVWSKCEHPHILQLLGVAKHQGRIAMVSPWMENGDLRWFLSQRPKVNRCTLCIQISEAVVYLHESNIVHGDIKGANIVVSQDYVAKLTDFGSATIKASSLQLMGSSSATNPAVSIRWAAPELVEGVTKCTSEGDIYALGMTFLEVITGSVPYAGFRDIAVLNKIINKIHPERPIEYIPIDHQHTDLLWSLLERCWTYDPIDRPAASGVHGELLQIAQAELVDPALHGAPGYLGLIGGTTVSTTMIRPTVNNPSMGQVGSATPPGEIVQRLVEHGCRDLTSLLDPPQSSELSLSNGNFRDVYRGALQDGTQIRLESLRFQAGVAGDGTKLLKRTAHEIYVWSKCKHANILPLSGVAQYCGRLTMISPWVEHNDLILFLSQQRSPLSSRLRLCVQLADAVAYLHDKGIVHGDIKASNVLLSHDMAVKLAGFGNMALKDYTLAFTPTAYGLGISVRWAAPEIVEGKTRLSSEADVYALGMTFLEILTGSVPYARLRDVAVLSKITNKIHPTRPLDQMPVENESAGRVWSLLTDCWKYDAKDRPVANVVHSEVEQATDAWSQARTLIDGTPISANCGGLSETPIEQIMASLASTGCHDITSQLHISNPNEIHRVGTCEEVYHATLPDCGEVQVRCLGVRISMLKTNLKTLKRAERELSQWSKCQHPHVLKLVGIARHNGQVAIVSPWMANGDLAQLLSRQGRVDYFAMVNQVVDAVAYLHGQKIVHGDIRAANVLVSKDNTAKLTGFEIVALEEQNLAFTTTTSSTGFWAPIRWAAPEIISGEIGRSTESDIYSLGMTILVQFSPEYRSSVN
ncbi:unnamed protein product [Rhizoctonia solani]|uniref:Protein kinase domain-containing protein n=1 Tax=Rhizoctonia solani TaxID=456999 RepID=A0A8H3EB70_9AGAM|nr:unnamed protein product [Rhizoctonia solani]